MSSPRSGDPHGAMSESTQDHSEAARWRSSGLLTVVVVVLGGLAFAYTSYLWGKYLLSIDLAGTVGVRAGRDFRAFSVAGSLVRSGAIADIYSPTASAYAEADAAAFVYPPWYAIGMIPFSVFSFQVGYWVWLVATAASGALGLWLVHRRVGLIAFGVMFATVAGYQTVFFGQSAFLILGLAGVVAWAMVNRKYFAMGMAAAFMAFKPHLLVGLGIVWLWKRSRFRPSILSALAVSTVLYVVPAVLLPGTLSDWLRLVFDSSGALVGPTAEVTLASAIRLLLGEGRSGTLVIVAVALAGVVWLAWTLMKRDLDDGRLLLAAFGMSVVVSAHALLYDVLLLLPGLVILWRSEPVMRPRIAMYGGATMALLTIGPIAVKAQLDATGHAVAAGSFALAFFVVWVVWSGGSPRVSVESRDTAQQSLSGGVAPTDT